MDIFKKQEHEIAVVTPSTLFSVVAAYYKKWWFILTIGLFLLLARAWPRLFYPEIWQEDGNRNLLGFINNGIEFLYEPVNGYLILVPKLLTTLAATISISQYPLISIVLAWGVTLAVFWVIAIAPIQLRGGIFLAVACMLVPSDPEVFGLPLYTFWWVSILLFVLVFWHEQATDWGIRAGVIFLASLSSPVSLIVLPLFWLRAWLLRTNRIEITLAVFATLCALIQVYFMLDNPSPVASGLHDITIEALYQIIPKFLGAYAIGNLAPKLQWAFGLAVLSFFGITIYRKPYCFATWGLLYLWTAAIFMTISRVPIDIIHPVLAGPRYFFYPFIIQSWFLLQIVLTGTNQWLRWGAGVILVITVLNTFPVLDRKHDNLHWQAHLTSCRQFENYVLPVHSDGNASHVWGLELSQQQCSNLLKKDPFYNRASSVETFPYRIVRSNTANQIASTRTVIKNEWMGSDSHSVATGKSTLPGRKIYGSFIHCDEDTGELALRLRRGDQIWFRTGPKTVNQRIEVYAEGHEYYMTVQPALDWVLLEFSNTSLTDEFDVKFVDNGADWGEWSAIGLTID